MLARICLLIILVGPLAGSYCAAEEPMFDEASLEFFEKEVRPILSARCLECHGGGNKAPKGGLSLTGRSELLKGGDTGAAIVAGKPQESLLVSAINYGDVYQMPPKSKLPANEIATLTKWVELGAPWPKETNSTAGKVKLFDLAARKAEHWCWQPIIDHTPPAVQEVTWPISAVDRFVLAKLEANSLKPAPQAERLTLLRRVYFDLIGLPPSPAEIEAFLKDESPQALEHLVDRLLGSAHFGERWGRHWLDLVRFAETRGHEFEPIIPNAWQYRDYVIRALNADVPYNRFLTEHIAGDLIKPRWREIEGRGLRVEGETNVSTAPQLSTLNSQPRINEAILGTGFWFLGEEVHSPVDIRKDETDRMDNRLDVLSKAFLGLTVACARCHDHKFDAISQRDYYALAGFVISGSYRQVRIDTQEQHRAIAEELDEHRVKSRLEIAGALIEAARPTLDRLDQYLLVAKQTLDSGVSWEQTAEKPKLLDAASREKVNVLAAEKQLDGEILARWIAELQVARADAKHPFRSFVSQEKNARAGSPSYEELVVDFGNLPENKLLQDGVSFGQWPRRSGQLVLGGSSDKPEFSVATMSGWERDLFWKGIKLTDGTEDDHSKLGEWHRHGRMVRTPEFTLAKGSLWYLVRGSVRAYAVVNSHLVIAGPLHGSVLREFKHDKADEWRWVSHPLELYGGHRMHVEFCPGDDEACAIAMVVASDSQPKLPEVSGEWFDQGAASGQTLAERARHSQQTFRDATANLVLSMIFGGVKGGGVIRAEQRRLDDAWPAVADWFVRHHGLFYAGPRLAKIDGQLKALREQEASLAKTVQWESRLAPAMLDGNGVDEQLLIRGNSNTPKEPVPRRFLEACEGRTGINANGSGRQQLVHYMLKSPLAARVAVNRVWHHLFGRGIVSSVDNFGVLGQPPTHPELLDHLASQFVREGWSQKKLIRSLILSRTYQTSSQPTSADEADPDNLLWHRMPIKRLEGEVIRDSILAVSGRLDRTPFGPSVPIHLTPFMQGRGRPGNSGPVDGEGRRSIYIAVRRNFLSPMMLAFDTPSPFSTVGRRTISNVPAQALILMNDPLVIDQAKRWADRLLADASQTPEQRIDAMYLTAFARQPTDREKFEAWSFLSTHPSSPPEAKADPNKAAREAWADLGHVLFNVKEFMYVE